MSPVWFFRLSLLLPLAIPLLLSFHDNELSRFMMTSLRFGGEEYVLFAIILYFWIGHLKDPQRIRRLSYWAPVLFIPVQVVPRAVVIHLAAPDSGDIWSWAFLGALMFTPFILVFGYGYVVLVNVFYVIYYQLWRQEGE